MSKYIELAGEEALIEGDPNDVYVQQIEGFASTLSNLRGLAHRHVTPDETIIDVGANIGLSTIILARACPGARVVAFEPSPRNAKFLRANLAANHIANAKVMEVALSDRPGELAFHEAAFAATSHVVSSEHLAQELITTRVPVTNLDDVPIEDLGTVSLIKIDVEGHEPNVLAGGRSLIQRQSPLLYMEFNAWCLNAFGGHSPAAFANALWQTFEVFQTDETGALVPIGTSALNFLHRNLMANGCVDDLVLKLRDGAKIPTLERMVWPGQANTLLEQLQRRISSMEG